MASDSTPKAAAHAGRWKAARIVAIFLCAMVLGYLVGKMAKGDANPAPNTVFKQLGWVGVAVAVALAAVTMVVVILLHEVGHLVGGWWAGFRFSMLVLGPAMLVREAGGVRLRLNRNPALYGGAALCLPVTSEVSQRQLLKLIAFGPGTSIVTGMLALALLYMLGWVDGFGSSSPHLVFGTLALVVFAYGSLVIGLATSIPAHMGLLRSDGLRMLHILRGHRDAAYDAALLGVMGAAMQGQPPAQWPVHKCQALVATDDGQHTLATMARYYLLHYHADLSQWDKVGELLHQVLAAGSVHKQLLGLFALDMAYYQAAIRHDAAAAQHWFAQINTQWADKTQLLRAEAAVLHAQGDAATANAKVAAARALLQKPGVQPGTRAYEIKMLDHIGASIV